MGEQRKNGSEEERATDTPLAGNVFVREERAEEIGSFLGNAYRETARRGLYDTLVVDCDCHHYEGSSYKDIAPHIDNPSVRDIFARYGSWQIDHTIVPGSLGDRVLAGRVRREVGMQPEDSGFDPVAWSVIESMLAMGIDYSVLFPTPMLVLGRHPQLEIEVEYSRGYNRWLTKEILPQSEALVTMPYLPITDPEVSVSFIEEFADDPSVVGFLVTAARFQSLHENRFMKVFAALEERGLPIAFHSGPSWSGQEFETLNRFLSVHALGFPFNAMLHLTNMVINGIPERFPGLRFIFMECGVTWLPFIASRLDTEYLMRPSEAPLLRRLPSEYIAEFFHTSQPLEHTSDEQMGVNLKLIDAEHRLLYASDYPHQDFDHPSTIADLRCIPMPARERILGRNAAELFGLDDVKLHERPEVAPLLANLPVPGGSTGANARSEAVVE
jgi:predicted TIM-barrel fold metal-dependent hydrolase